MDERPETVSFGHHSGPHRRESRRSESRRSEPHRRARWPRLALALLLIAAAARLAMLAWPQDGDARVHPILPATAFHTFPDGPRASFSVTATTVNSKMHIWPTLRLSIRGRGQRGQRYGLLGGLCSGQFVTPSDWAEATADKSGNLRFVAKDVPGSLTDPHLYLFVYRLDDGVTLGGIQGPLLGADATPFAAMPPC